MGIWVPVLWRTILSEKNSDKTRQKSRKETAKDTGQDPWLEYPEVNSARNTVVSALTGHQKGMIWRGIVLQRNFYCGRIIDRPFSVYFGQCFAELWNIHLSSNVRPFLVHTHGLNTFRLGDLEPHTGPNRRYSYWMSFTTYVLCPDRKCWGRGCPVDTTTVNKWSKHQQSSAKPKRFLILGRWALGWA